MALTGRFQELGHFRRQRLELEQVLQLQRDARRNGGCSASEPRSASGGMIAFTREPSGKRASTIGDI